ncbi:hypothetical protein KZX46_02000 (plasmid) [Polymorphobacter sp. PAMC 29334]|uniref:hypothetical protein n=1 Tax=Polymorphobacter sp. PAMC 29334 TaxID=2862331 RepID=UPI001C776C29|nr:hypothetical protein [Polymorphobacter sp. PAMC 29334]QYE32947.1 hypothetical protein KZX46_02000 [Polymorphobacter sp. PAMC 29334]
MSRFYDVGPLGEIAVNLFHGWGYNFYRRENQLRADDQLVRSYASDLLAQARKSVEVAEAAYRRLRLPAPTRAHPLPDAEAVTGAQTLERLSRSIGALEGQIRHQPVPENDRMSQRYRSEAETLELLGEIDKLLIGQADLLRSLINNTTGEAVLEEMAELEEGIKAVTETLRQRQAVLFVGVIP